MAFDVYSVIRSEEVRDHARKYWDLEPEDKALLIHFSFFPIDDKVRFYMELIDGKNEISRFYVDDDWLRENGISEAVIDDLFNGGNGGRHSYPFANFGSVLLQTPLMEKPLKCKINSDLDGNYCWYQWLYPRLPEILEYPGWRIIRRTIWHCQHCGTAPNSRAKSDRI